MTTGMPNVFELRIVAFGAWWYDGDIDIDLVRPSNVHPPHSSRTAGIRKSIQPPTLAIADSKQGEEHTWLLYPEDKSEYKVECEGR